MLNYSQPMLKDDALKGKTIVITGGGTGLGKAMGVYFLKLGANLVITSRKLDVLQKTADEMEEKTGGKVLAVACDVRDAEQVDNVLAKTIEKFGEVHVLFRQPSGYRQMLSPQLSILF
jgi:NAD(P)-dependent dehydrogenase (short-subunit alcohol dehydrogenase family)